MSIAIGKEKLFPAIQGIRRAGVNKTERSDEYKNKTMKLWELVTSQEEAPSGQ